MSLEKSIASLEKNRIGLKSGALWLLFIMSIRFLSEAFLLGAEIEKITHFVHNISYFFFTFLMGIFLISILAKEKKVRKIFNASLFFYPLILLPPLIDHFIFQRVARYEYLPFSSLPELLSRFPTLFLFFEEGSYGVIIEGLIIGILAMLYVGTKTKSFTRGLIILSGICFLIPFTMSPSLYIPSIFKASQGNYSIFYLSLSVISFFLLLWRNNPQKFSALIKNFRPIKTSHFLLLVFFGSFLAHGGGVNVTELLSSLLAVFFLRQFSIILNDIFDLEIDKISNPQRPLVSGAVKKNEFLELGSLFLILSFLYTILMENAGALFLILLSLILVCLYTLPPFRLRKTIFGTSFVGVSSSLAFIFGYISQGGKPNTTINFLAILIFLSVSLAGVIKDRKDYQGDKKAGVRTLYTIFGLKKAKKISLAFVAISFLLPLFLFHRWYDFLFFTKAASIATLDFRKNESHERILFYAFLLFIYCFLRIKLG